MSNPDVTEPAIPEWTLGWRLKRALAKADISVQEMADELGYSRGQVSLYLNDKGAPPRRPILRIWALRCGVPFEWLAHGITDNGPGDPSEQAGMTFPWDTDANVVPLRVSQRRVA